MRGSLRTGNKKKKAAVQESASESFWNLLQDWSTRVSRWKRWKKIALAFTFAFILFVIFVLATSTNYTTRTRSK
jgi:hypothetical protein